MPRKTNHHHDTVVTNSDASMRPRPDAAENRPDRGVLNTICAALQ